MLQRIASVLAASLGGLVPGDLCRDDGMRAAWFVASRLLVGAGALAAVPFCLAAWGRLSPAAMLVLAGFAAQTGLALLVARGVPLSRLHPTSVLAVSGSIGIAAALAPMAGWALSGLSLALIVEAAMLAGLSSVVLAGVCAVAVFAAIAAIAANGAAEPSSAQMALFLAGGFGVIVACVALGLFALALRQSQQLRECSLTRHARALPEAIGDPLLKLDGAGAVTSVAGDVLTIGLVPADLLGRGLFDRIHVADRPAFLKVVSDALHSDAARSARLRLRTESGGTGSGHLWFDLRLRAIAPGPGEPTREVICLMRDVTEQVDQREAFERLRTEVEPGPLAADRGAMPCARELEATRRALSPLHLAQSVKKRA